MAGVWRLSGKRLHHCKHEQWYWYSSRSAFVDIWRASREPRAATTRDAPLLAQVRWESVEGIWSRRHTGIRAARQLLLRWRCSF